MMRAFGLSVLLLGMAGGLVSCEEDASQEAQDLGIQEGRRDTAETQRPAPGRGDPGAAAATPGAEAPDDKKPDSDERP